MKRNQCQGACAGRAGPSRWRKQDHDLPRETTRVQVCIFLQVSIQYQRKKKGKKKHPITGSGSQCRHVQYTGGCPYTKLLEFLK